MAQPELPQTARVRSLATWQRCLLAFAAISLLMLTGVQGVLGRFPKQLLDLTLAGLLVTALATHPVFSRACARVGASGKRLALGWPVAVLVVDALNLRSSLLYPLVSWSMFTAAMGRAPDPEQIRFFAHHADGTSARLMPGAAVSDVVASALDGELRASFATARQPSDRTREAVLAVARMQERADPQHPIVAVSVERCRMPVKPPYQPSCTSVAEISGPER